MSLEESGFLIKEVNQTIKNETKERKRVFLSTFLQTLGASLLGNLFKKFIRKSIRKCIGKIQLEPVIEQLEHVKIFNVASSFK